MSKIKKGEVRNPYGRAGKPRQTNADGWSNVVASLGNSADPVNATRYAPDMQLDISTLDSVFSGDGIGKRVVNIPVDDAMREGIEAEESLLLELGRIGWKQEVADAARWARLYGGCLLLALVDDGQELDQPINYNRIESVVGLRAYDRYQVTWTTADLDQDYTSANFGRPAFYTITPINGGSFKVHYSRVYRFEGEAVPEYVRARNNGWADSSLQSVYQSLSRYGMMNAASANIVRDFVQAVLGVKDLAAMLQQGQDEEIAKRAKIIDLTRSVANMVMLDADGETYEKKASSVAGLADLIDRAALNISGATGIPATKLLGRAPSGLNSTGDNDIRQWYDVVKAYQGDELSPAVTWLIDLLKAQKSWAKSARPESYEFVWPSLWQPSEKEWAEIKHINAQTDAIYIDRQAVDAEYITHLRYGQGQYQPDITITLEGELEFMANRVKLEGGG